MFAYWMTGASLLCLAILATVLYFRAKRNDAVYVEEDIRASKAIDLASVSKERLKREADQLAEMAVNTGKKRIAARVEHAARVSDINAMNNDDLVKEAQRIHRSSRKTTTSLLVLLVLSTPLSSKADFVEAPKKNEPSAPFSMNHPETGEDGAWVPTYWLRASLLCREELRLSFDQLRLTDVQLASKAKETDKLRRALVVSETSLRTSERARKDVVERNKRLASEKQRWYRHPAFLISVGVLAGFGAVYAAGQAIQ